MEPGGKAGTYSYDNQTFTLIKQDTTYPVMDGVRQEFTYAKTDMLGSGKETIRIYMKNDLLSTIGYYVEKYLAGSKWTEVTLRENSSGKDVTLLIHNQSTVKTIEIYKVFKECLPPLDGDFVEADSTNSEDAKYLELYKEPLDHNSKGDEYFHPHDVLTINDLHYTLGNGSVRVYKKNDFFSTVGYYFHKLNFFEWKEVTLIDGNKTKFNVLLNKSDLSNGPDNKRIARIFQNNTKSERK